jgi:hypothetical protein
MNDNFLQRGFNADLEHFELTDIMQLITQQVKSGILAVKGKEGNCSWSFNDGQLVGFSCHFPNHSIDLESILIKSGMMTRRQFDQLVERHGCRSTIELERALIENELLTREKLEEINLRRLIETFIITLQWTKGQYRFIPTTEIASQEFFPHQDANFVMLEALRQIDEMAIMEERLQPLDRCFETALSLAAETSGQGDQESTFIQQGLDKQFNADELEVYNLFNGFRTLEEILNVSTLGRFHTCRIILNFLDRGIITPPAGDLVNYRNKFNQSKLYQYTASCTLVIFCICLLVSILMAGNELSHRARKNFFQTLINNIHAIQEKERLQALELLQDKTAPATPSKTSSPQAPPEPTS